VVRRGELYLADLGDPIGHEQASSRPVLVVSSDPWLLSGPPVVTVLPVTRSFRHSSSHVELEPGTSGLAAVSYAKCEDIRAISPERITRLFGHADALVMARVDLILRRLLAL
jgi:mRNA interferase MazF